MKRILRKYIIPIAFIFVGFISIICAFKCFSSTPGYWAAYETYGGDAYTGIQNAAVDTARNIRLAASSITSCFGYLLLTFGLFVIVYGVQKFLPVKTIKKIR